MEEKIIVKSEKINIKLIRNIIYVLGFFLGFVLYLWRTVAWKSYREYDSYWHREIEEISEMNIFQFMFSDYANNATKWAFIVTFIVFIVIGTLFYYGVKKLV